MAGTVLELLATCELVEPADYTGSPGGTSFSVVEYAVLEGGRRLVLLDDRGWTQWTVAGGGPSRLAADDVRRDVLNVVLPDDAEVTGETHEWDHFVERLSQAGVVVSRDELRRLPYVIVFGERLRAALEDH